MAFSLVVAGFWAGCAAGSEDPVDASGGADPGTGGTVATGGAGGMTGVGGQGQGGDSLCGMDCSTIDTPACQVAVCNDGTYQGTVGQCVVVDDEDGTACDDGAFCTTDDSCQAGQCVGGPVNDCGMAAAECEEVVCDDDSDSCAIAAANEGMSCTSDDPCTVDASCSAGQCVGGTPKDCFFAPVPNECHVSVCNPNTGACEPVPGNENGACTDPNDLCTVDKTCTAGQCVGGQPKDCSQLTSGCNVGVCDPTTGVCGTMAAGEGNLCDDLDACTTGEICTSGVCGGGDPVTTCSQTGDGCCPSNCTDQNDYDCACPGTFVNGTCVYLTDPTQSYTVSQAQSVCQGLGTGWDMCSPTLLCDPATISYLGNNGCDCSGGTSTCNCSGVNVYVHVTGPDSPYYIRDAAIANCGNTACTDSVSASCGVALCCKP